MIYLFSFFYILIPPLFCNNGKHLVYVFATLKITEVFIHSLFLSMLISSFNDYASYTYRLLSLCFLVIFSLSPCLHICLYFVFWYTYDCNDSCSSLKHMKHYLIILIRNCKNIYVTFTILSYLTTYHIMFYVFNLIIVCFYSLLCVLSYFGVWLRIVPSGHSCEDALQHHITHMLHLINICTILLNFTLYYNFASISDELKIYTDRLDVPSIYLYEFSPGIFLRALCVCMVLVSVCFYSYLYCYGSTG